MAHSLDISSPAAQRDAGHLLEAGSPAVQCIVYVVPLLIWPTASHDVLGQCTLAQEDHQEVPAVDITALDC